MGNVLTSIVDGLWATLDVANAAKQSKAWSVTDEKEELATNVALEEASAKNAAWKKAFAVSQRGLGQVNESFDKDKENERFGKLTDNFHRFINKILKQDVQVLQDASQDDPQLAQYVDVFKQMVEKMLLINTWIKQNQKALLQPFFIASYQDKIFVEKTICSFTAGMGNIHRLVRVLKSDDWSSSIIQDARRASIKESLVEVNKSFIGITEFIERNKNAMDSFQSFNLKKEKIKIWNDVVQTFRLKQKERREAMERARQQNEALRNQADQLVNE